MPSPVGRQIGRTAEHLLTLWAAVFQVDDSGAAMPGQLEGIHKLILTQDTQVVTDDVDHLGQLFAGLLRDGHRVVGRVDISGTVNAECSQLGIHRIQVRVRISRIKQDDSSRHG